MALKEEPPRVQLSLNWAETWDKKETVWGHAEYLHLPWKLGCLTREALKGKAKGAKRAENKQGPTRQANITPYTPTGSPQKASQRSPNIVRNITALPAQDPKTGLGEADVFMLRTQET